jgi:type VI secretion system protein ImpK
MGDQGGTAMNQKEPSFSTSTDQTVFDPTILVSRPYPGSKPAGPVTPPAPGSYPERPERREAFALPPRRGPNSLENAATTLLNLMTQLKNTLTYPDIEGLLARVQAEVKAFQNKIQRLGISQKTAENASYVLCTAVDDIVLNNTAWGSNSSWRQQSLLVTFHGDTQGGEKFFQLLDTLLKDPAGNRELLELMYIGMALGFQGRYRSRHDQLEEERERLYHTLHALQREEEPDLSIHWQGVAEKPHTLSRTIPLWVIGAVACALLVAIYGIFLFRLSDASDPVWADFAKVTVRPPLFMREAALPELPKPLPKGGAYDRLRTFLAPEISRKEVDVDPSPEGIIVRIRGDGLFESSSAVLNPNYQGLLQRIAAALKTEPGRVLVIGHTDNIPIRTLRFPSNWKLSQARAETVAAALIASTGTPDRFTARGEAETKPLCSNATAAGRACNRRVEITLMADRP